MSIIATILARKNSAIGIFYPVEITADITFSDQEALRAAIVDIAHKHGWEINAILKIEEAPDETVGTEP